MLLMLVAPAIPVSAQADAATEFSTVVGQLATMTPVAGPLSGSLDAANADSAPAGVSVANGVAHAEFTVPNVNAGTLWAMAVLFRVTDAGQNFLLIFPDGTWQLDNGQGGAAVTGTGATFDTTPGTTVAVDVLFDGATGAFGLNGTFVSALDLTAVQDAGDVELTGYLGLGAGATTLDYSNFSVYDLSGGAAAPTATTAGAVGVPTESATAVAGLPGETPTTAAGLPGETPTTAAGVPTEAAVPTTASGGDASALFSQYLAQENSQPVIYGPQSGTLVHDPEKVTFLDTGVTASDFGAHIECTAPRTAAELWDCGLAFRDTNSPNHFRLGVVSDGHWFLSIGNQDPLQSGEGIPIPPNAGDKVALDLIVIGNTGYFGVDGTFVSELDLSALPGPGSVAAVIGFFNETYVAGGETPYEDFIVWSFDQGTATPGETAVVGVPTTAPTVALPPVETPTSIAGPPTQTPAVGLPTETPIAGTTAVVEPTASAGTSNVVGNTYTSPTFGYQLTWDPTWSVVTESSQNQFDVLRISNGVVTTDLYSGVSSMSLQECITSLVDYYNGNASYANVVLGTYADGQQILTQGNVAIATLTFDYTDDTGATTATTDSVICASMPSQGALVTMESYIPTDQVATQQSAVTALEAQLVVDGAPVALPPIPGGGVPTEVATVSVPPTEAAPPASETAVAVPTVASGGNAASAVLSAVGGSTVSGIGSLAGQARTVNVTAIVTNAETGSAVGIAHGTCAELANVLEPDYYVGDTTETGIVQGTVPVSMSVLLTRGPYSVVIYGPGDGAPMVACGEITG
jgi:hypothetical protein